MDRLDKSIAAAAAVRSGAVGAGSVGRESRGLAPPSWTGWRPIHRPRGINAEGRRGKGIFPRRQCGAAGSKPGGNQQPQWRMPC